MSIIFPGQKYWGRLVGDDSPQQDRNQYLDRTNNLAKGVIGCWRFKEGAGEKIYDESGHNNHGTLKNGPTWVTGRFGAALSFDGTDDYVDIGSPTSLTNLLPFTISLWFNSSLLAGYRTLVGESSTQGFYVNGNVLDYFDGGDNNGVTTLSTGTWYHAAVVVTSADKRVYLNGNLDKETISGSNSFTVNAIGRNGTGAGEYFNGLIDDVRIYNRDLSSIEIRQLYEEGVK